MWITIVLILVSALCTAGYMILTQRRRVPNLNLNLDELPPITHGASLMAGLTGGKLYAGNLVTVWQNGEIFNAFKERMAGAKYSIHFESFVWTAGELESDFVTLLCRLAEDGIKIRLLLDAVGSMDGGEMAFESLKRAGVDLRFYCRARWLNLRRFNHRTHRKLLIIDGRIAFTFGHGISDLWTGNAQDQHHYRDTGVCIEGPAAAALQSIFMQNWIEETKDVPSTADCFPHIEPAGDIVTHAVSSATGDAVSSVALLYTLAMASARREIIIQNPYFAPEKSIAKLLGRMVARGVQVHLMVPGARTDSPYVRCAGRTLYRPMLEAGVRIYEFCPTLLHQKIVIVDGVWSHVGSTNLDARALALNEEVGVGILDKNIAQQLRDAFVEDLKRSEEIHLKNWLRRPWYQRIFDRCLYFARGQM